MYHEDMNKYLKITSYLKGAWQDVIFVAGTDKEYINQVCDYNENADHDDAPDSLASIIRKKILLERGKRVITYQEFIATYKNGLPTSAGVEAVVNDHKASDAYKLALIADDYDRQKNTTIMAFEKMIHTMTGASMVDPYAANHKIPSNMFRRLNTQRNQYSLGNGVTFKDEATKDKFGADFDTELQKIGYAASIPRVRVWILEPR